MNVHTRAIADLLPEPRGGDWRSRGPVYHVSPKYLKNGPDDIFYGQGGAMGADALYKKTDAAGVDSHLMDGLGFRPTPNPGGSLGSVWVWATHDKKHVITNRGMKELAAHVAVGAHTAPKPGAPNEGVMSEASRLVESVLQGASPRGVITRALDEAIQTVAELQSAVEAAIRRSFPHGQLQLRFSTGFGSPAISGRFTIAANSHELVNGIEHNDLGHTIFFIYGLDKDGNIPGPLTFDPSLGGKVIVNPGPGSYMAYDSVRVGLAKKRGTPEQIVKHIEGYFAKLLATLRANRERLPQDHVALLKSITL